MEKDLTNLVENFANKYSTKWADFKQSWIDCGFQYFHDCISVVQTRTVIDSYVYYLNYAYGILLDMFSQSCNRFVNTGILYTLYTLYMTQRDQEKKQTIHIHIQNYHNLIEFTHYLLETNDIDDILYVLKELHTSHAFSISIHNHQFLSTLNTGKNSNIQAEKYDKGGLYIKDLLENILEFPYLNQLEMNHNSQTNKNSTEFIDSLHSILQELPQYVPSSPPKPTEEPLKVTKKKRTFIVSKQMRVKNILTNP